MTHLPHGKENSRTPSLVSLFSRYLFPNTNSLRFHRRARTALTFGNTGVWLRVHIPSTAGGATASPQGDPLKQIWWAGRGNRPDGWRLVPECRHYPGIGHSGREALLNPGTTWTLALQALSGSFLSTELRSLLNTIGWSSEPPPPIIKE